MRISTYAGNQWNFLDLVVLACMSLPLRGSPGLIELCLNDS